MSGFQQDILSCSILPDRQALTAVRKRRVNGCLSVACHIFTKPKDSLNYPLIMKTALLILCACFVAPAHASWSQPTSQDSGSKKSGIYLNQIGFYPAGPKKAIVIGAVSQGFEIVEAGSGKLVFTGTLSGPRKAGFSDYTGQTADFSTVNGSGTFIVRSEGVADSYPFEIKDQVLDEVAKASIKGFYYQRMSTALKEKFAGKWARKAGHPDTVVYVHPSAASSARPEGTVISAPKGWYDAGDYNKYVVNSGITMGTLMSAYEDFPEYYKSLELNIPESGDGVPDILDEVLWNLRWMLKMQDTDGGVYHKLTTARFEGMVMPNEATSKRWVVQKSTTAALDFAAVTAQAARVFSSFESHLPGLADSCLTASKRAWAWARQHPDRLYRQEEMNSQFEPDVHTGAYGDNNAEDELIWAACELYATTGDETYYEAVTIWPDENIKVPSWRNVLLPGYYTLVRFGDKLEGAAKADLPALKDKIKNFADHLVMGAEDRTWQTVMGASAAYFVWGSSAVAANQGVALIQAYKLTGDEKYLHHALSNVDYLLGRNATGFSFVTGFGEKSPMFPHHRPSVADGVDEPVPGLLSGGPNPGQQDNCAGYPSKIPDESFVDDACSYASNEIAINWNAPLAYLLGAVEALRGNRKM